MKSRVGQVSAVKVTQKLIFVIILTSILIEVKKCFALESDLHAINFNGKASMKALIFFFNSANELHFEQRCK
jgi:hypothetical protein